MDEATPPLPQPAPIGSPSSGHPRDRAPTRRWFLAGGAALIAGGSAGAITELVRETPAEPPPPPPAALIAAADAERALIADLDATTGGTPSVRAVIVQTRANHAAHLAALTALLSRFRAPSPSSSPAPPRGTPRTVAALRDAEQRATSAAARHAAALSGGTAALLASIAACEATHAALLQ